MDRPQLMAIVLVVLGILLVLMVLGWRMRARRQSAISAPQPMPVEPGEHLGTFTGNYVATTKAGDPLDRIAVHGLGFRGRVSVAVFPDGLALKIAGRDDFWIAAGEVLGVNRATWTIDRVVEPDGLVRMQWRLGSHQVDTYMRLDERSGFEKAMERMTGDDGNG